MTTSAGQPVEGQSTFGAYPGAPIGAEAAREWFASLDAESRERLLRDTMRNPDISRNPAVLQGAGMRNMEDVELPDTPVPLPPQSPYATTSWASPYFDFTVPSGQTCQLKKLGMEDLMSAGLLDMMNELGVEVDGTIRKAKGQPPMDFTKMLANPQALRALTPVLDKILIVAVNQPKIHPAPEDPANREPGVIYPDHVDLADKIAIMSEVVGDLSDLKSVRPGT